MSKQEKRWFVWSMVMIAVVVLLSVVYGRANAASATNGNGQETCPQDGGWTKIDSNDLSLYPVSGATEYCFKAGQWVVDSIPAGGFGQDGPCPNGPQFCDLSHWSFFVPEPECEEQDCEVECEEEDDCEPECEEEEPEGCENEPTTTPTDVPGPTSTPVVPDEPERLPSAGFTSQTEIMNGEPWQLSVPGNVWAGHNQTDWPAGQWWLLWEGREFLFNDQWYTTVEYIVADPTEAELIGRATDFDLMLITCRGYDPVTNTWAQRLVIFANLSQ